MVFPKNNDDNQVPGHIGRLTGFSDYKVADDHLDVRGWQVVGADGIPYGEVKDLIVDRQEMKTRYLEVRPADRLSTDQPGHLLVPIGMASLDENRDLVYLARLDRATFAQLPPYDGGPVTAEYQRSLRKVLRIDPLDATAQNTMALPKDPHVGAVLGMAPLDRVLGDADIYSHAYFNENAFYASRQRPR